MFQAHGVTGSVILPEPNMGGRDFTTGKAKEAGEGWIRERPSWHVQGHKLSYWTGSRMFLTGSPSKKYDLCCKAEAEMRRNYTFL